MNYILAVCITSLFGALSQGAVPPAEQKPVVRTIQNRYEPGRFTTIDQLWSRATAVVDGDVVAAMPYEEARPTPPPRVITAFGTKIRTIYKRGPEPGFEVGSTIRLVIQGGTIDRGSHVEEVVDERFPLPVVGGRYILFLINTRPTESNFGIISADGVFRIEGDRIHPVGASPVSIGLRGQTVSGLSALLADLAARR